MAYSERKASEARWKTKKGFDNKDKVENFNAHPKKPPQAVLEDLRHSYAG